MSDEAKHLCEVTKQALDEAIKVCRPGVAYREIGGIINYIADKAKFGVIREYVGHGVGRAFHSAPTITHFRNNQPGFMKEGQTFTIEPMLVQVWNLNCVPCERKRKHVNNTLHHTQGSIKCKTWKDKWTVVTEDGGLCAQYEHTLLITANGAEILTKL